MNKLELQRRCLVRDWKPNNFTYYLIESGRNSGQVAVMLGCPLSTTHYWLRQEQLTNAVNVLFLLVRKVKLMYGYDLLDLL